MTIYAYTTLIDPGQGSNGETDSVSINDSGQVTGSYWNGATYISFIYGNGTFTDFVDPSAVQDGGYTRAVSINDSGQVTGYYYNGQSYEGFIYNNGTFTDLIDGNGSTTPLSINDSGQVVGYYSNGQTTEGFIYSNGTFTNLIDPSQALGGSTTAEAINSSGQVVGVYSASQVSVNSNMTNEGFIYSNGTFTNLIDPSQGPNGGTVPEAINDSGQVTGVYYQSQTGNDEGFLYSNGTFINLIDPSQGPNGYTKPESINDGGQVAGYYFNGSTYTGFIYSNGVFTDLITPSQASNWYILPLSINNSGQVTGYYNIFTTVEGFIATPADPGPSITSVTPSVVEDGQTTEIGTVTPGLPGDTLTLQQTSGSGTVALQLVNGVEEVIYTAPAEIGTGILDSVTYTITDQLNDAVASGSSDIPVVMTPSYTYTTIDPPGSTYTDSLSVNNAGQIVGSYKDANNIEHGFLDTRGIYTTIDPSNSIETVADGISANGQVIGWYLDNTGRGSQGFLYSGGTYTAIDPPGSYSTEPTSINAKGDVVGYYQDSHSLYHSFLYSDGTYSVLDYPGAYSTLAQSINAKGEVVGLYQDRTGPEHGFLYNGGTYTVLNVPGAADTMAYGINDSGEIVGQYQPIGQVNGSQDQGFLYNNGTYTILSFPGAYNTEPLSINSKGEVVGYYELATTNGSITSEHGFLYSNGVYTTIDPPSGVSPTPTSINDAGQIVGFSYTNATSGVHFGFLATPTDPGPSITPVTPSVVENGQTTEIGTVTPGLPGDTLTLNQTGGNGALALQLVNGVEEVIYTAPSQISASTVDAVSYTITDQYNDVAPSGSVAVQLDAGPSITSVTPSVVENGQTTEIGTVTPGLTGDTLTLQQTSGSGTVALQLVNGVEEVIYTAPSSVTGSTLDAVSYTITDQYKDAVATGSNTVPVAPAGDTVYVGTRGGSISVGNGNSAIDGRAGNETITAGNGADVIFGGPNSTITAGNGADTIYSGANSNITAGNGNDAVAAGANSSIKLGNGNDTVTAGANSTISVGNGTNNIFAGANDLISVGTGHDTVAFGESPNPIAVSNETINGFNSAHDMLQFNPSLLSQYATAEISQVGANTVIQINPTNSVTLDNVTATALTANNFHFS
jgi:probable HAF family extracellular repeat protein